MGKNRKIKFAGFLGIIALLGILCSSLKVMGQGYGPYNARSETKASRSEQQGSGSFEDEGKGFISLSSGWSSPIGNFSIPLGNYSGNYALPGYSSSLTCGFPLGRNNFGFAANISQYINSFDINNLTGNLTNNEPNPLVGYAPGNITPTYNEVAIMVGGFYTFPYRRFSFDASLLGGAAICYTPDIFFGKLLAVPIAANSTIYTSAQTDAYEYYPATKVGACMSAGVGVRFSLRRNNCINLNFDYFGAVINYTTKFEHDNYANSSMTLTPVSTRVLYSLTTISLGFGWEFNLPSRRW